MSEKCNCNSGCGCKSKKDNQGNFTSSVEEGCDKNKRPNPKTATNNQW